MRLNQAELRINVTAASKEIGVSKATLSRINREIGQPDVSSYYKCCKWLGQSMDVYFLP